MDAGHPFKPNSFSAVGEFEAQRGIKMCLKKDHWDRSKDPSLAFSRQDMEVEDKAMCSEAVPTFQCFSPDHHTSPRGILGSDVHRLGS